MAPALRSVLRDQANVEVLLAEVTGFDLAGPHRAGAAPPTSGRSTLAYDTLVVATGVQTDYFGRDDWAAAAPGLKSLEDARWLRSHILGAFEMAELAADAEERRAWLTFVVVGAGPTGVELTGEIATLAHRVAAPRFSQRDDARGARRADGRRPHDPAALLRSRCAAGRHATSGPWASRSASNALAAEIDVGGVTVQPSGAETAAAERLQARTIIWAAGVRAAPAADALAAAAGAARDRIGRLVVAPDLSLPGHPEVLRRRRHGRRRRPAGRRSRRHAAGPLRRGRHRGARRGPPAEAAFRYHDKGTMATVGPAAPSSMPTACGSAALPARCCGRSSTSTT